MPYWPLFGHLTKRPRPYRGLISDGTYIDAKVLVVDPGSGLPSTEDLAASYEQLMAALMSAADRLSDCGHDILEAAEIKDAQVRIRDIVPISSFCRQFRWWSGL